jgi:hypothetical protein
MKSLNQKKPPKIVLLKALVKSQADAMHLPVFLLKILYRTLTVETSG